LVNLGFFADVDMILVTSVR